MMMAVHGLAKHIKFANAVHGKAYRGVPSGLGQEVELF